MVRARNNWEKPHKEHIEELKELLLSNIYGCDIEEEAVRLTYFSLSLALLMRCLQGRSGEMSILTT